MRKKLFILTISLVIGLVGLVTVRNIVLAEQSGSSPESGAASRIKTIYDSLVALTHGSDSAGGWGNWGVMWNRIRSAAEWVPSESATEADVATGKTFHNTSRTQKTGTAAPAVDYSTQSKVIWDDYKNGGSADGDSAGEESNWSNTVGAADTGVWKDERTGLYWSIASEGGMTNSFTIASCDYFSTSPRSSYAGGDSDRGDAINYCANLNLASGGTSNTDWYLPSQKELTQAYLDGIYNQTDTNFTSQNVFWSSTEVAGSPSGAWADYLNNSYMFDNGKSDNLSVRCVRRD
jgi:hypothetical protein